MSKLAEIRAKVAAAIEAEKLKPKKPKPKKYTDYHCVNYILSDEYDEWHEWMWNPTHPTRIYFEENGNGSLVWPTNRYFTQNGKREGNYEYLQFRFNELEDAEKFAKKFGFKVSTVRYSHGPGSYF
jgi:hypothetical protein